MDGRPVSEQSLAVSSRSQALRLRCSCLVIGGPPKHIARRAGHGTLGFQGLAEQMAACVLLGFRGSRQQPFPVARVLVVVRALPPRPGLQLCKPQQPQVAAKAGEMWTLAHRCLTTATLAFVLALSSPASSRAEQPPETSSPLVQEVWGGCSTPGAARCCAAREGQLRPSTGCRGGA